MRERSSFFERYKPSKRIFTEAFSAFWRNHIRVIGEVQYRSCLQNKRLPLRPHSVKGQDKVIDLVRPDLIVSTACDKMSFKNFRQKGVV